MQRKSRQRLKTDFCSTSNAVAGTRPKSHVPAPQNSARCWQSDIRANALSLVLIAVIVSSIGLSSATSSTHVDPNGNALPESQVAGASADQEAELAKQLQNPVASQSNFD